MTQWKYSTALIQKDQSNKYYFYFLDLLSAHEHIYLLIQSLVTKQLDLKGFHRLHACGIQFQGLNLFLPLSMGHGKTTHFLEFIKDSEVTVYSDDSPLFKGSVAMPMPFRVGLNPDCKIHSPTKNAGVLRRQKYGEKNIIPISDIGNTAAISGGENIFMFGQRSEGEFSCRPLSKILAFFYLLYHMGIGVGLPMVREIYLTHSLRGLIDLAVIFLSRLYSILSILSTGTFYLAKFSHDPSKNTKAMKKIMTGNF